MSILTSELLVFNVLQRGYPPIHAALISIPDIVLVPEFSSRSFGLLVQGNVSHAYCADLGSRETAPIQPFVVFTAVQDRGRSSLILVELARMGARTIEIEVDQFPFKDQKRLWHWYNDFHVEVMIDAACEADPSFAEIAEYVALRERKPNGFRPLLTPVEEARLKLLRNRHG